MFDTENSIGSQKSILALGGASQELSQYSDTRQNICLRKILLFLNYFF